MAKFAKKFRLLWEIRADWRWNFSTRVLKMKRWVWLSLNCL